MSDMTPFEEEGTPAPAPAEATTRKPRVAIMGEFSAGKSTLSNLLLGARPLPERVTATRLSPVWIVHGDGTPVRCDVQGHEEPITLDALETAPVETTRCIRLPFQAEILRFCDLIDFPGISDPNMDSDVWERMLDEVDMVLWCTHATQAWRQSEAAAWDMVPDTVRQRSLLLVTRFDKLVTERDKKRVLNRLAAETAGLFAGMYPVSLLQALRSGKADAEGWTASGAAAFSDALMAGISGQPGEATGQAAPAGDIDPDTSAAETPAPRRIVPRRVRVGAAPR
ncbi:dynamin family protein, partial [Jannaschia aquimarina]|uniref:dynamin family protein n=1 Tax=Jannaschia aquimarina TaxID=935700 RepID=UPI000696682C